MGPKRGAVMKSTRKTLRSVVVFMAVIGMMFGAFAASAVAEYPVSTGGVTPGYVAGNPTCADLGFLEEDGFLSGKYDVDEDMVTGVLPATFLIEGKYVSWTAKTGFAVYAVIVKGGPGAHVYLYDGMVTSDSGLVSPMNDGSNVADVSHIDFCYKEVDTEVFYWCSPGFWKTRAIEQGTLIGSEHDPSDLLNDPLPGYPDITVGEALLMTGQYSNIAADYLSAHFFDPAGTQDTEGAFCPINAFGEWVGMED
jgi:hypothetical protein